MIAETVTRWRGLAALVALALGVLMAGPVPSAIADAPVPVVRQAADGGHGVDQSLRMDRKAEVFTATGYQTLTVAGLAGGAALVGAMAGGASTAIVAGSAVVLIYLFIP